jgi:hypothetical protein
MHGYVHQYIEKKRHRALGRSPAVAILEQTNMVRMLPPAAANLNKRLAKSPKIYLRDSGILHALFNIEAYDYLLANSIAGASWEGFVIENLIAHYDRWRPPFMQTSNGAEIDLVLERAGRYLLFECKLSKAPKPSRGFHELVDAMQPASAWVFAPVDEPYEIARGIVVCSPQHLHRPPVLRETGENAS